MIPLAQRVHVNRRFRKSIRIDTDLTDPTALEGFICPESSASVLRTMALHVKESEQAAFTWTGPYGVGKSSLVIALSAVLNPQAGVRAKASHILGPATTRAIWEALPPRDNGVARSTGGRQTRQAGTGGWGSHPKSPACTKT